MIFSALLYSGHLLADSELNSIKSANVKRIVTGILSYTRWPHQTGAIRLCVISPAHYADDLPYIDQQKVGYSVQLTLLPFDIPAILSGCDAVYFGDIASVDQQRLITESAGQPLLTIAENNTDCTQGSIFCLNTDAPDVAFSLNLDLLARSRLRVSSSVLQLAKMADKKHD